MNIVQKVLLYFVPWPALMKLINRVRKTQNVTRTATLKQMLKVYGDIKRIKQD